MRRSLLGMAIAAFFVLPASAAQFSIDAVKAAYLFRFASYVEWPQDGGDAPFVIGVCGAEEVAVHLERLTAGVSIRGRPATVRRVRNSEELQGVNILYVGPKVFRSARSIRQAARSRPVLLVTDNTEGLASGGVINFIQTNRNLRFEISMVSAERVGLKIDSALLAVATRVDMGRTK